MLRLLDPLNLFFPFFFFCLFLDPLNFEPCVRALPPFAVAVLSGQLHVSAIDQVHNSTSWLCPHTSGKT